LRIRLELGASAVKSRATGLDEKPEQAVGLPWLSLCANST